MKDTYDEPRTVRIGHDQYPVTALDHLTPGLREWALAIDRAGSVKAAAEGFDKSPKQGGTAARHIRDMIGDLRIEKNLLKQLIHAGKLKFGDSRATTFAQSAGLCNWILDQIQSIRGEITVLDILFACAQDAMDQEAMDQRVDDLEAALAEAIDQGDNLAARLQSDRASARAVQTWRDHRKAAQIVLEGK